MTPTPLYEQAFTYLVGHEGQHLAPDRHLLVNRCINHLIGTAHVSYETAKDTTMQAFGELESRGRPEHIDVDHTTSYALFLVDREGNRRVYTVAELVQLIYQAQGAVSL